VLEYAAQRQRQADSDMRGGAAAAREGAKAKSRAAARVEVRFTIQSASTVQYYSLCTTNSMALQRTVLSEVHY
jgi:hypothetical protein